MGNSMELGIALGAFLILLVVTATSGDSMYDFDPFGAMGSQSSADDHIRQKRKAAGTTYQDTQFTLTKTSGSDTPSIGDLLQYRIDIWLPQVTNISGMDLTVEILSSDPETGQVGLALCKPTITAFGSQITSISYGSTLASIQAGVVPQMFYNPFVPQVNDKAVLEFGALKNNDVLNDAVNTSSIISITFCAAVVDSSVSLSPVYLTAGADYADETFIWIGQDLLTPSYTNRNTPYASSVNVTTSPAATMNPGDSAAIAFDAAITYPFARLSFAAFDPDYHEYVSIGYVGPFISSTTSYFKENNLNRAVQYLEDRNYKGNVIARETVYQPLISMRGPDMILSSAGNKIPTVLSFCIAPDAPAGDAFSIATAVTIGTSRIFVDVFNFTVGTGNATRTAANNALFVATNPVTTMSDSNAIPSGGSVIFLTKMSVATAGWFQYTLTVTPPTGFSACTARMEFHGGNIGCVPQLDNKTVTLDNSTGALTVSFVAKQNGVAVADPTQNEIWVAVTVSGGTAGGTVNFKDTGNTANTQTINVTSTMLSASLPSGQISSVSANKTWYVGGQVAFDAIITLPAHYPLSGAVFEAMGDTTSTAGFDVRICRAEISFAGEGVGCLNPNLQPVVTYSKSGVATVYNDKASMPLGSFCASNMNVANTTDQTFIINVVADLPPQTNITATAYKMSAGVSFTGSVIWVANTQFNTAVAATLPPALTGTVLPMVTSFFNSPISSGGASKIPFAVKIPPGATSKFTLSISSSKPGVSICALSFKNIGKNFPCVDPNPAGKWGPEQVTRLTYTRFDPLVPTLGNQKVDLDLGVLTNIGTYPLLSSSPSDASTIVVEVIVGVPTNTAPNTVNLTATLSWTGGTPSTYALPLNTNRSVTPAAATDYTMVMIDRDTKIVGGYARGLAKKIDVDIYPTDPTKDLVGSQVGIMFVNENPATQPYNICCASLSYAGSNYPCLNHTGNGYTTNTTNVTGILMVDTLTFTIGDICYSNINPVTNDTKRLTVEVYIIVDKYNGSYAGPIDLKAKLVLMNATTTNVASLTLNKVPDTAIFPGSSSGSVDLIKSPNVTSTVVGTPISLRARGHGMVAFNICTPANDLVIFEPAVLVDSDSRARGTVVKITSQAVGTNIACMADMTAYYTDYLGSPNLTSSTQKDQAILRTYYIRNTGFTNNKTGSWKAGDDCMTLWAEIEATDHPLNSHNSTFSVSVGARVGSIIEVEVQPISVLRPDANEYADITVNISVINGTNTTVYAPKELVYLSLTACHSPISNREALVPIIRVIYPPYMDFDTTQTLVQNTSYTVTATKQGTSANFQFPFILFTDCIQLNFSLTVNPNSTETPATMNAGVDSTTLARVVCQMKQFLSPTANNPSSPLYYHCGDIGAATYLVKPIGCPSVPLGMQTSDIKDCQITASTAALISTGPLNARPGGATYWSPALNSFEPYLEIHFGNLTEISSISLTVDPAGAQLKSYRIQSSFDGIAFSDVENGTASVYTPSAGPIVTRFLRVIITETSDPTKLIGLKLEPMGCYRTGDLAINDTCPYVPATRYTDDVKSWRHVAVDVANNIVYFCIYHTTKLRTICYSGTSGGTVWQNCPSYIGYFAGVDKSVTPNRVIAVDGKDAAYVYSSDGVSWTPMTAAEFTNATTANFDKSTVVPSHPSSTISPLSIGSSGWKADNKGINQPDGTQRVDWSTCCN